MRVAEVVYVMTRFQSIIGLLNSKRRIDRRPVRVALRDRGRARRGVVVLPYRSRSSGIHEADLCPIFIVRLSS